MIYYLEKLGLKLIVTKTLVGYELIAQVYDRHYEGKGT